MTVIDPELASEVATAALETGGEYADVLCQRRSLQMVRYEDGRLDDLSLGIDSGAGVRVIKGDLAAYAHTDILDREHMMEAALTAAEALRHATAGTSLEIVIPDREAPPPVCADAPLGHEMDDIVWYR